MLDISTPNLLRTAVDRAMNNKTETRRLLVALGACRSGRLRHAGKTYAQAWAEASSDDLYWVISVLRRYLYNGSDRFKHLERLSMIATQVHPGRGLSATKAKLYRAWFYPNGELRREWNL